MKILFQNSSSVTYLNLICIHASICNKNLCIFNSFWLVYTDFFVKQKPCILRKRFLRLHIKKENISFKLLQNN